MGKPLDSFRVFIGTLFIMLFPSFFAWNIVYNVSKIDFFLSMKLIFIWILCSVFGLLIMPKLVVRDKTVGKTFSNTYFCKRCKKGFTNPQAVGGHMRACRYGKRR